MQSFISVAIDNKICENMVEKPHSHRKFYVIVTIVLAICIGLAFFLSLGISAQNPPASLTEIQTPSSNQILGADESNNVTFALITEDEAIELATPLIQRYATENNRTIISINSKFYPIIPDINGSRGGLCLPEVLSLNLSIPETQQKISCFPEWSILATFDKVTGEFTVNSVPSNPQYWIYGYSVLIWADNGQIRYAEPQGID
jgi:hypothetical protein